MDRSGLQYSIDRVLSTFGADIDALATRNDSKTYCVGHGHDRTIGEVVISFVGSDSFSTTLEWEIAHPAMSQRPKALLGRGVITSPIAGQPYIFTGTGTKGFVRPLVIEFRYTQKGAVVGLTEAIVSVRYEQPRVQDFGLQGE